MDLFMLIAPHKNLGHTVIDTRQKYFCVNSCLINGTFPFHTKSYSFASILIKSS